MNDERRKNLDKIMELSRAPLIDKLEKALEENGDLKEVVGELLEILEHAVNWGYGFESVESRPEWLTEAEQMVRKVKEIK